MLSPQGRVVMVSGANRGLAVARCLPGTDGVDLVQWLAKRGAEGVRLIVVTGYSSDYARHTNMLGEAMGLDPISVLTKPVAVATLRQTFEADRAA